jgi:fructosamine-3-kinase
VKSDAYGWPADYAIGAVELDNRSTGDWPDFWGRRRLLPIADTLDRAWRERVERVAARLSDLLPERPAASLLHGDLWTGNILVSGGEVVGLIDPACYHGHGEVDLAMVDLFCAPPDAFREAYGPLEAGWRERLPVYQLFHALLNLRLWGERRAGMVDRLLTQIGA